MGILEDLLNKPIEALATGLIVFIFIFVFSAMGSAFSSLPGGQQAATTANLGIIAILTIVSISGIIGTIAFGKEIIEAIEGLLGGDSGGFL